MKIGNIDIQSGAVLAPMAGVTDLAFREICRSLGAVLTYTEMISSKALIYQDQKTRALLKTGTGEHPVSVQIFGSDAETMGDAAVKALEISGADILDINMGCPTPKIVRNGDGCALMQDILKAARIIETVKNRIGDTPLTVKFRKGWDKGSINAIEFAKMAEHSGADAVCVHGRTRAQMYSGRADYDIIAGVKQSVNIPVIANGDAVSAESAVRILNYTKADLVMAGRASFGNPWLFAQIKAALAGEDIPPLPPLKERCLTAVRQFKQACEDKGERIAVLEARKHYAWYLKGVPHASIYREKISQLNSMDDIYTVTKGIIRDLR